MKLEIMRDSNNRISGHDTYWLACYTNECYCVMDKEIANVLNIPWKKYKKLIESKNVTCNNNNIFNFKSYIDAENFIKELEPYVILATLVGD